MRRKIKLVNSTYLFYFIFLMSILIGCEVCRTACMFPCRIRAKDCTRADIEHTMNCCVDQNYNSRRCYLNLACVLLIKEGKLRRMSFQGIGLS